MRVFRKLRFRYGIRREQENQDPLSSSAYVLYREELVSVSASFRSRSVDSVDTEVFFTTHHQTSSTDWIITEVFLLPTIQRGHPVTYASSF